VAAEALLTEGGVEALSLRRLAARLGVTTGAIYHHFGDKAELLAAIVDRGRQRIAAAVGPGTPDLDARGGLRTRLKAFGWALLADRPLSRSLLLAPGAVAVLGSQPGPGTPLGLLVKLLADASARGEVGPLDDPGRAARLVWTAWQGLVGRLILEGIEEPAQVEAWMDDLFEVLWKGLGGR